VDQPDLPCNAAHRSLALKFHPDKAGQTLPHAAADAIFKLVTAANATLSDAEKRRAHDLQCLRHKYRRFYSYHF
jgi:DnaJ-class molecular chaperone